MGLDISGLDYKKTNDQNEISICCPYCIKIIGKADTGYHLGVNLLKGVYHCFRCESVGRLSGVAELELLSPSDRSDEINELKARANGLFNGSTAAIPEYDLDSLSWGLGKETPLAYEYIRGRGYSDAEIEKYQMRVGHPFFDPVFDRENNKWSGRILFPYYFAGRCIYLVGRSYSGKEPKYLNTVGQKSLVVYGIETIVDGECILCEGIVSSHTAARVTGKPAVCTLGKSFTQMQIALLRARCNRIWMSYDADIEIVDRQKLTRQLFQAGFDVWDIRLPLIVDNQGRKIKKDPDDFSWEYIEYFRRAKKIVV